MNLLQDVWSEKRRYVSTAMYWSGAAWLFEKLMQPKGALILMYHSVADAVVAPFIDPPNHLSHIDFEAQMAFLSRYRHVVSLTDLMTQLDAGHEPPAGTVCITFDDGYLDNLTVAAPILAKYQLPATLYLPTAYIDRRESHWADVLHQMFLFRTRQRLTISRLRIAADLSDAEQRNAAYKKLHQPLLTSLYAQRQSLLAELREQLCPEREGPQLTMGWDDVRDLVQKYPLFDIGGHGQDHVDLRAHGGEYARDEIEGCRRDIRRELGTDPLHFSFPYARSSVDARSSALKGGWKNAVGSGLGVRIRLASDRFAMPRLSTPMSMTELRFKTCGAFPGIYALIGK